MSISRTVRIVAAGALAVLGAFGVACVSHGSESGARAMDTTYSQSVDGGPSAAAPADTTWSQPLDGGVSVAPMDTTW